MNSLIIKTTQFVVFVNFWLLLLFGLLGGMVIAHSLDTGYGASISLGARTLTIASPGSYILFGAIGLLCMLFVAAPLYAWWAILHSSNQLLRKIERNTAAIAASATDANGFQHDPSTIEDFMSADPRA